MRKGDRHRIVSFSLAPLKIPISAFLYKLVELCAELRTLLDFIVVKRAAGVTVSYDLQFCANLGSSTGRYMGSVWVEDLPIPFILSDAPFWVYVVVSNNLAPWFLLLPIVLLRAFMFLIVDG